jgi:hypothetical protein
MVTVTRWYRAKRPFNCDHFLIYGAPHHSLFIHQSSLLSQLVYVLKSSWFNIPFASILVEVHAIYRFFFDFNQTLSAPNITANVCHA